MVKAYYTPALGEQYNANIISKIKYHSWDLGIFSNSKVLPFNIVLQSAYYGKEHTKKISFKEKLNIPKETLLIGDSGGFQIASFAKKNKVCKFTKEESLKWLENNCDIAMNLDVPPNLDGNPSLKDFKNALKESVKNFEYFQSNRKNKECKFYNVLHGETKELLDIWYNEVKKFKFEGWAIGMKPPSNPMIQALGFCYLHSKGEFKNKYGIHFFGTSGENVIPIINYCAHKLKEDILVTFDSSSYNIGSIYRTYYLPGLINTNISFGDKYRLNPNIKTLPCNCPVCSLIKSVDDLNTNKRISGILISLHNLYQYKRFNEICQSLVVEKKSFLEYLKKLNLNIKVFNSIEMVDYYFENGFDKMYDKYKNHFQKKQNTDKSSKSLLHF